MQQYVLQMSAKPIFRLPTEEHLTRKTLNNSDNPYNCKFSIPCNQGKFSKTKTVTQIPVLWTIFRLSLASKIKLGLSHTSMHIHVSKHSHVCMWAYYLKLFIFIQCGTAGLWFSVWASPCRHLQPWKPFDKTMSLHVYIVLFQMKNKGTLICTFDHLNTSMYIPLYYQAISQFSMLW